MILIDTSCWTQALRRVGDPATRDRVRDLLERNVAAWCDVVRLELWNGAGNDWDRDLLRALEATVHLVPITPDVWTDAIKLASRARSSGLNVPPTDLIIFACARVHGLELEHRDRHYELLKQLAADA